MVRIKNTPQIKDKKGVILANDILVKAPNGKMFINESKMQDDAFLQSIVDGDVQIVGGKTPDVWVEVPGTKVKLDEEGKAVKDDKGKAVKDEEGNPAKDDKGKDVLEHNDEYDTAEIDELTQKRYVRKPITSVNKTDKYKKEKPYKTPIEEPFDGDFKEDADPVPFTPKRK